MNLTDEDIKTITNALIKASNASETEWLTIEKTILESYKFGSSEISDSNVQKMWNQLYQRVVDSIERTKTLENANG
jgi:hypothetical protein